MMHLLLAFLLSFPTAPALDPAPVCEAPTSAAALDPAPAAADTRTLVHVRVVDWRRFDRSDVVGPACEHLRLRCVPSLYTTGVVTILLTDPVPTVSLGFPVGGHVLGVSSGTDCEGRVWAVSDIQVVAHELGHALSLDHTLVEGNLMFPSRDLGGMDLTDDQRRAIRHGARVMRQCA